MTGFYGEMVYWVHSRVFVQDERFLEVLEVVDSLGQCTNRWIRWDIGVNGGGSGSYNGVGC